MEPTIRTGDMIVGTVISAEEKAELQEGDIITYFIDLNGDGTKELNTHRIVEKRVAGETYTFRTKGDNPNSYSDHDVDDGYNVGIDDILCTWKQGDTQIAGLGAVIGFLQSSLGFLLIVIIPLVLLFVYEIVRLIVMIVKIKGKEGNKEISEAEKEEIRRRAIEEYKRSLSQGESAESDNPTEPDKEDAE